MHKFLYNIETFLKKQMPRSKFLKIIFLGVLFFFEKNKFLKYAFAKTSESNGRTPLKVNALHALVIAKGNDPYQNTIKAIEALGGMKKFVKKGATVVVKPNMAWDRNPEQAANTNPHVVAALVELCYKAGAKRVNVFDIPCNDERRVYENSGIEKAAKDKGAYVFFADHWNVVKAKFPYQSDMENWPILRDAVRCDTFINVPILKHHWSPGLTISMKNLMGVCSGTRGLIHINMGPKLVDLTDFIKPELTVVDATRVLTKHGPSGGNLDDVLTLNKIIASVDPTLADIVACALMKKNPYEVSNIKAAMDRNFGITDISKADIVSIQT